MAKGFRIRVVPGQQADVVLPAGALDGSSAAEVVACLRGLAGPAAVLDFSRVHHVEPFGARVLAVGLKELRREGRSFELDGLVGPIAHALCLGGVLEAACWAVSDPEPPGAASLQGED